MADIELIVKIPRKVYKAICDKNALGCDIGDIKNIIRNGTPLPKGHGDLVTKEQIIELVEFYQLNPQHFDFVNLIDEIKDEKPIIEADKAESKEQE